MILKQKFKQLLKLLINIASIILLIIILRFLGLILRFLGFKGFLGFTLGMLVMAIINQKFMHLVNPIIDFAGGKSVKIKLK